MEGLRPECLRVLEAVGFTYDESTAEAARAVANAPDARPMPATLTRFEHAPSGRQTPAKRKYWKVTALDHGGGGNRTPDDWDQH